jgi:hypothetical protein
MRDALGDWIQAQAALIDPALAFMWKEQVGPSPPKPYVGAGFIALGVPEGQDDRATRLALRVTAATPGATYGATVAGETVSVVAGTPTSLAAIRDALVDELVDALGAGAATASYPDALELGADIGGPIVLVGALERRVSVWVLNDAVSTLSVDVFASTEAADDPASMIAGRLERSLGLPSVHEALSFAGWAPLSVISTRRAPIPLARGWENRAGFDLRLRCRTRARELVHWLEYFDATSHAGTLSP